LGWTARQSVRVKVKEAALRPYPRHVDGGLERRDDLHVINNQTDRLQKEAIERNGKRKHRLLVAQMACLLSSRVQLHGG
jgi:hypothetical protein